MTDIEGSTELWDAHPREMDDALTDQEATIESVVERHAGTLLRSKGEGDSTLSVFERATDALTAALELQRELVRGFGDASLSLPTRIAIHTGEASRRDGSYHGS